MERKMNPFKLFDAGADLISSAAKSAANKIRSGPSVSERLFKSESQDADAGKQRLDQMRVALSIDDFVDIETATYRLALIDKKSNQELMSCDRRWSECEPTLHMIRSMYPKLDVPAPPPRPAGRAPAIVVEERRKYVQAFLNVCAPHATVSKMKEVQQLVGLVPGLTAHSSAASPSPARSSMEQQRSASRERSESNASQLRSASMAAPPPQPAGSAPREREAQASDRSSDAGSPPGRQVSFASPDRADTTPTGAPAAAAAASTPKQPGVHHAIHADDTDERLLIDECFKLVDVDNSGYVTEDELAEFQRSLPKHVSGRAVQQCLNDVGGDPNAIDAKTFRQFMNRLAQVTRVSAEDIWRGFRRQKLTEVYEAIGDAARARELEVDREKLKPLLAVLQTGGLKVMAPSAMDAIEYAVPYTYAEYEDVMGTMLRIMPAHELINAMRLNEAVAEKNQCLAVINKYAGKAPADLVRQLKDMVARYGGTSCSNCAAVQAKHDAAEQQMRLLRSENDNLSAQVQKLKAANQDTHAEVAVAREEADDKDRMIAELNEELQKMKQEVIESTAAKEDLVHRICEVEVELELERESKKKKAAGLDDFEYATESDDTDDEAHHHAFDDEEARDAAAVAAAMSRRVNMHFLMPAHLGSHDDAPVVDRPGALVYDLERRAPEDMLDATGVYQPMGFSTNVYVSDPGVAEYLALRTPVIGATGKTKRSLSWCIEGGYLSCGWVMRRAPLPTGKWVRVSAKLRWDQASFDILFDGVAVDELTGVPFRDGAAADVGAGTLDVYPRDSVAVYYANMHFFR